MTLTLDTIVLGVTQPDAAHDFYLPLSSTSSENGSSSTLHLRGGGGLALQPVDSLADQLATGAASSGFRGHVLSSIVVQPSEVETLLDSALRSGATLLKPAKKQLFGEFTATYRAPDGTIWKLAAASKKNSAPAHAQPTPLENAVYLGVASPKASSAFFAALGMSLDHDYGDKFIDFTLTPGAYRLGLLPRKGLAKDVGVTDDGQGFAAAVLAHGASSREDVDRLLTTAESSGGSVVTTAAVDAAGTYSGTFTDLDGYYWKVFTDH